MKTHVPPFVIIAIVAVAAFAFIASPNGWVWFICIITLLPLIWLCSGERSSPVFLFVLSIAWLQVIANVALVDYDGLTYSSIEFGKSLEKAVTYGLLSLVTIAAGLRVCNSYFGKRRASAVTEADASDSGFDLGRLFICYVACAATAGTLDHLARVLPGAQIFHSLGIIRFACVYLIAAVVFRRQRGYGWLLLVVLIEVGTGMIGFFAGYKEPIFIVLIAAVATRQYLDKRAIIFGIVAVLGVVWMSMIWTVIKVDYRTVIYSMSTTERIAYVANRYAEGVDYDTAIQGLLSRVEYTTYFANVIEYNEAGILPDHDDYYLGALEHITTPRILFPEKPPLSDSEKSSELLGGKIAEGTSIGIGFVAEAYADFGFPGMLLPMFVIGALFSLIARYFMTRPVPLLIREAMITAACFVAFTFETNIDKGLGAFLTNWIAFALALKFGYRMIAPWLFQKPQAPLYAPRV